MSRLLHRVGFASCARIGYNYGFKEPTALALDAADFVQPVWGEIAAQHVARPLDAMLLLGDQVYSDYYSQRDPIDWPLPKFHGVMDTMYRAQYEKVGGFKQLFMAFKAAGTQIGTVWDDHDFGYNNGSGREPNFRNKLGSSKALFDQFWDVLQTAPTNYPSMLTAPTAVPQRGVERIKNPIKLKDDVEIIFLDSRFYKTPGRPFRAEMVGPDQWLELENKLKSWNSKKLLIVCSGSPYSFNGQLSSQSWERRGQPYAHFKEFTELARGKRIIFLSGDIHSNAFKDHGGFCEVISSGAHVPDDRTKRRYGLLEIYADKVDVKLYLNNAVEISKTISRATGSVQQ
jgi:hypothetical protein